MKLAGDKTMTHTRQPKQLSKEIYDVVVIGAGPAGMMAAGRAGERGLKVLLLEKNSHPGKKLLITGGGRCNVTNNKPDVRTMLAQYKSASKFLFSTFATHSVVDTIEFFNKRQVALVEENEGRMFPEANTAEAVTDAMVQFIEKGKVELKTKYIVSDIAFDPTQRLFVIRDEKGQSILARRTVVASGGTSRPETGSTGDGYAWLTKLGHTVINNNYALVPVAIQDAWVKKLGGVSVSDAKVTILADGKKVSATRGRILFTHFGVSGPTILNASKEIGELLNHSQVTLLLDMVPTLDAGALKESFIQTLTTQPNKKLKNVLSTIVKSSLVAPILELALVDGEQFCHSVRVQERTRLLSLLKAVPLSVSGLLGKEKAVISAGGVKLEEINFKTMESKIVPGLYVVGDMLNIDRPSGGYSLQLCWSTGYVAGSSV